MTLASSNRYVMKYPDLLANLLLLTNKPLRYFLYFSESSILVLTKQYETPCRRWKRLTSKTCACREHVAPWEKLVAPSEFSAWAFDAYVRRNAELNGSWISWAILHWRIVIPRIVKKWNGMKKIYEYEGFQYSSSILPIES